MPVAAATIFLGPYPLFCLAGSAGVIHLTFEAAHHEQARLLWTPEDGARSQIIDELAVQVREYGEGRRTRFAVEVDPRSLAGGTVFQQRVWALLAGIPFGEVRTYGELAMELGGVHLARAVGQACHRNPLSLVVPCHRVVGASGRLCGFAGGLSVKVYLLALEEVF